MARKKILFLSDAVSTSSGFARIARDLAIRVHQHLGDIYEVASVGYGGTGSRSIPFTEYKVHSVDNWLVPEFRLSGTTSLAMTRVFSLSFGTPPGCTGSEPRKAVRIPACASGSRRPK